MSKKSKSRSKPIVRTDPKYFSQLDPVHTNWKEWNISSIQGYAKFLKSRIQEDEVSAAGSQLYNDMTEYLLGSEFSIS